LQKMQRLKHRRDFLAAAKALSQAMPGLVLQGRARGDDEPPRVGFTCTKKIGNAVVRNRVRRRLREAARLTLNESGRLGFDYVLIGRAGTANRTFEALQKDIISALQRIHAPRPIPRIESRL
jgi:ribonuclease P protein component